MTFLLFLIFLILLLIIFYTILYNNIEINDTCYISFDGMICKVIHKEYSYVTISTSKMIYDISIFEFLLNYRKLK